MSEVLRLRLLAAIAPEELALAVAGGPHFSTRPFRHALLEGESVQRSCCTSLP
jgi:hypothetical protein